jgi:hypothetical protein
MSGMLARLGSPGVKEEREGGWAFLRTRTRSTMNADDAQAC